MPHLRNESCVASRRFFSGLKSLGRVPSACFGNGAVEKWWEKENFTGAFYRTYITMTFSDASVEFAGPNKVTIFGRIRLFRTHTWTMQTRWVDIQFVQKSNAVEGVTFKLSVEETLSGDDACSADDGSRSTILDSPHFGLCSHVCCAREVCAYYLSALHTGPHIVASMFRKAFVESWPHVARCAPEGRIVVAKGTYVAFLRWGGIYLPVGFVRICRRRCSTSIVHTVRVH